MGNDIIWLDKSVSASGRRLIGPKATSLCALRGLGLAVPPCFFVTTRAFREHLDAHGLAEQVDADAAGVAFTVDPVTGSPSRIVIEACAGLGDALVSGRVQPDRLVLRKKNAALIHWDAPDGVRRSTVDAPGCTVELPMDLTTARQLVRRVVRIESGLGCPQDIEWAARDGRIWILQARPITVVPPQRSWEDRQVWTNSNLGEVMPDVTTPATWSMFDLLRHTPKRGQKARGRVRARSDALRALDTDAVSNAELADAALSSLRGTVRDVDLLYLINGAAGMPVLERAYKKWLGETDLSVVYRLFAAQGGMADAEAGLAMWFLA